ncbi:hydrogen peroxide-dependent heme synthase [Tundrisphaera sp. TA3]|uniref:hydrogen peroxide-dependent heme synthase n=1 Tax=Tundrisphaera sp. TA3 TaxID=3435775 RepID=UPI003EBE24F9
MSQAPESPTTATPPTARPGPPAQHGHRPAMSAVPATLVPEAGWHFLHLFYRIDRAALAAIPEMEQEEGRRQIVEILGKDREGAPDQIHAFAIPGHKADFGVMMAGPDLRAVHNVEVALQASKLGPALVPTYSFYSITEISEYVPDAEAYGKILRDREGVDPESPTYATKVKAYADRLGPMNKQRLYPEFPDWPCLCFYPMSKMRQGDQNWYLQPFEHRTEMMAQHGKSGMKFAGKVMQVITASTGLDDWEWGVTLWGRNPSYLKDIVYSMRFDESSAKYALFGPFYFGFILPPVELLDAVRL